MSQNVPLQDPRLTSFGVWNVELDLASTKLKPAGDSFAAYSLGAFVLVLEASS